MTLLELKQILVRVLSTHPDYASNDVVVETANGGVPHRYLSPVETATPGFDWTHGRFIIRAKDTLVRVNEKQETPSLIAAKALQQLKEEYAKLSFEYVKKAHEYAWKEGFAAGIRAHVTACVAEPDSKKEQ